eukprot:GHVU01124615.1.p1 GENE.GHVU01124615.1~~GHVU01124615.1.p1  ORF type:complete len:836 (-),score=89.16 GHVU01124615.1:4-2511(-)
MVFRLPEAVHFTDHGKAPDATFHKMTCKGCDELYASRTPPEINPKFFPNRGRSLAFHLSKCEHHAARLLRLAAASSGATTPLAAAAASASSTSGPSSAATTTLAAATATASASTASGPSSGATTPAASSSTAVSASTGRRSGGQRQSLISTFVDKGFTQQEAAVVKRRALQWMCSNNLPFNIFTHPSTHRLFEAVRVTSVPLIQSFTPRAMSETYLRNEALAAREQVLPEVKKLEDEGCAVGLRVDGWESCAHRDITGVMVGSGSAWFAYEDALGTGTGNVGEEDAFHGIATAAKLEAVFLHVAATLLLAVCCLCTDEAGEMSRAKKILALRWPAMYFLKCYAHQVNRLARDVLMDDVFKRVTAVISAIVTNVSNSKIWRNRLRKLTREMYGKEHSLVTPTENRWNSYQACFAMMLRLKSAIQTMFIRFRPELTSAMEEMRAEGHLLWPALEQAEASLRPVAKASMVMQRENNSLADVVNVYGMVLMELSRLGNGSEQRVEARWKKEEQPLLLLACFLDARRGREFCSRMAATTTLNILLMVQFAIYYWKKFVSNDHQGLAQAVTAWHDGSIAEVAAFEHQVLWKLLMHHTDTGIQKLAKLAQHIRTLPVQTASCERLFSQFGLTVTSRRNRISSVKVHYCAAVKADVKALDEAGGKRRQKRPRIMGVDEYEIRDRGRGHHSDESADEVSLLDAAEGEYPIGGRVCRPTASGGQTGDRRGDVEDDSPDDERNARPLLELLAAMPDSDTEDESAEALAPSTPVPLPPPSIAEEIQRYTHSTGEQYRREHPLPDYNDKYYPQLVLKGVRAWKIPLKEVFPLTAPTPEWEDVLLAPIV